MNHKIKTIIAITGIRGSGKSEASKIGKERGFLIISMEDYYLKYGAMYPNHYIQDMPDVVDALYEEARKDIIESSSDKIIFEATGTNPRWRKLINELKKHHKVQVVQVFVNADTALKRMGIRGWNNHYPTKKKETLAIIARQSHIKPDVVIENNVGLEDFRKAIRSYFEEQNKNIT